ncbi:MAG: metallophosphoesterase [Microcystaceae cyanobacterium]
MGDRHLKTFLRLSLGFLLGICLFLGLHGCQPQQPLSLTSVSSQATPSQVESNPLPPATKAIIASAEGGKLYNPPRGTLRLVVISDLNNAYGSTDYDPEIDKAMTLLPFWQPDIVLCSGDMVAGQNRKLSEEQLKAMWSAFDDHVASPLRQAGFPYGFTLGNHDASSAKSASGNFLFQRERDVASNYWNDPEHSPGVEFVERYEFPFYYTFKLEDAFFLSWDASSAKIPEDKLEWVKKALSSPEAQSAKIRIVLGHLPLYAIAVGRDRPGEVMENANQLREMLEQYDVHTYISGHHHAYYPAHKGNLQLLYTGILGSGPRPYIDSQLSPQKALTVVDINFDSSEMTQYTTYDIQTLKLIELTQLPRFLTGHNGRVLRRDIEMNDLTEKEGESCILRLGDNLCRA